MARQMADDMSLYADTPTGEAPPDAAMAQEESGMEEGGGEPTAILPMEILAGKEFAPGDSVILRIVALHDDSVEVAYDFEAGEEEIEEEIEPPMTDEVGMEELMG